MTALMHRDWALMVMDDARLNLRTIAHTALMWQYYAAPRFLPEPTSPHITGSPLIGYVPNTQRFFCRICPTDFAFLLNARFHEEQHLDAWLHAHRYFVPGDNDDTFVLGDAMALMFATLGGRGATRLPVTGGGP